MVVGGYSNQKTIRSSTTNQYICKNETLTRCKSSERKKVSGLINDVELVSLSTKKNYCAKFVNPVLGSYYNVGKTLENEAEALGQTGVFSKGAAIVCGGKSGGATIRDCWELDSELNKWVLY